MPFERMLDKEPKQFEIFQRFMGYLIIALVVMVYYFTSPIANYQFYVPFFIGFIFIVSPKLSRWLEYSYGSKIRKNIYFLIDVIVVSTALAAVHLSLVVTFVLLFALIYTAINNKI
ncbi:MAG: adenylate/guanylate cyclase domain-containing protein, partial [Acinetobacter sp.]|nr:adenylate/guanylate cyclase domain-containing protein [Acinetobacter sp.]